MTNGAGNRPETLGRQERGAATHAEVVSAERRRHWKNWALGCVFGWACLAPTLAACGPCEPTTAEQWRRCEEVCAVNGGVASGCDYALTDRLACTCANGAQFGVEVGR